MAAEDGELDARVSDGTSGGDSPPEPSRAPAAAYDEPSLAEFLAQEPYCFSFFAALRVLAQISAKRTLTNQEPRSAVEQIHFRAHQAFSFPPSELWELKTPAGSTSIADMTVTFLGLTGSMGALPRPYTELVIQRIRKGDFALRDFFDIFNHRLIQVFARAGEKYRFYFNHEEAALWEQARRSQGEQKLRAFFLDERPRVDLFSQILLDLSGAGTALLRYRDSQRSRLTPRHEVPDSAIRYFAGQLAQTHRCGVSLERMVADYFQVAAEIIPFVGQWIQLPVEHQTCLRRSRANDDSTPGARPAPGQCSHPQLGHNAVVGSRVFEVQGRFRVRLGPLTFDEFKEFLPVGDKYHQLAHFVRLYVGATFDFDIQPVLKGDEVPWCQLGAKGSRGPRLGWNTWLRNREFTNHVDDAIFRVPDEVSMSS
jgi:type VI secretion system protein ImpH